jgi:hypothetical protein
LGGNLSGRADFATQLDESSSFDVIGKDASSLGNDGGGFIVFINFLFEDFSFFSSESI